MIALILLASINLAPFGTPAETVVTYADAKMSIIEKVTVIYYGVPQCKETNSNRLSVVCK